MSKLEDLMGEAIKQMIDGERARDEAFLRRALNLREGDELDQRALRDAGLIFECREVAPLSYETTDDGGLIHPPRYHRRLLRPVLIAEETDK